ncbi:hypothetical protein GCM10009527_030220 [Actinomadura nitritigenes]
MAGARIVDIQRNGARLACASIGEGPSEIAAPVPDGVLAGAAGLATVRGGGGLIFAGQAGQRRVPSDMVLR